MNQQSSTKEQLRAELQALANTVDEMLQEGLDRSREEVEQLKAKAARMALEAKVKLQQSSEDALVCVKEMADKTDNYVREKPWTSIGIGAAVGVVIGLLMAKR